MTESKCNQSSGERLCVGCSLPVRHGDGVELELISMQLQGEPVSVLCQECYDETPSWVWTAE